VVTPIRIRPATASDTEAIVALCRDNLLTIPTLEPEEADPPPTRSRPALQTLRDGLADGCLLAARGEAGLLACGGLCLDRRQLTALLVSPAARRSGLARRMVAHIERLAVQFGLLELQVRALSPSVNFYLACGYRLVPTDEPTPSSQDGLLRMRRAFSRRQTRYGREIAALGQRLGVPGDYGATHRLRLQPECKRAVSIGPDVYGREARMAPRAARAWLAMRGAALCQGVQLQAVSAFRTVAYQAGIIERKLAAGQDIGEVLRVSAAPGFSEHHSGCALDITAPGFEPLHESFEKSPAHQWLSRSADRFGFRLSYPRGNRHGVAFEPWHWCWHA
jgi:D-alanyl-D-alanine carboxypeptidase